MTSFNWLGKRHNSTEPTYLGTGNIFKVEDFIDLVFDETGVDFEKKIIANRSSWVSSKVRIQELARDKKDCERILASDKHLVEQTMGIIPTTY